MAALRVAGALAVQSRPPVVSRVACGGVRSIGAAGLCLARQCRHVPVAVPVRWGHGSAHYKDQRERRKRRAGGGKPAELYDLLEVDLTATTQEIKDAFLKQVRLHHPDISPNPDAAEMFDKIKKALEVLSDSTTRREYDSTTCGVQPDWVYGEEDDAQIPLAAMTEDELQKRARYLDERISSSNANIAGLGEAVINAGGVQVKRLAKELEGYMEQRKELRVELQKIAASKLKRGGNRGRKKASERLQTAGTEWWDVRSPIRAALTHPTLLLERGQRRSRTRHYGMGGYRGMDAGGQHVHPNRCASHRCCELGQA